MDVELISMQLGIYNYVVDMHTHRDPRGAETRG